MKNKKFLVPIIIGSVLYITGFLIKSPIGSIIMGMSGLTVFVPVFQLGRKSEISNRYIRKILIVISSIFIIVLSIYLFLALYTLIRGV